MVAFFCKSMAASNLSDDRKVALNVSSLDNEVKVFKMA